MHAHDYLVEILIETLNGNQLPYISVHKTPQMSKDTLKKSYDPCKASDANTVKNKCIRPIYLEIVVMVPCGSSCSITSLAQPCFPPLHHMHKMCVAFRCNRRFLSNHVESQGGTHIGMLL